MLNVKKAARKIADLHTFMINTQSLQKFLNVATFSTLFFQIFQNAPQITQFFVILSPAHTESTEASHRSQSHGGLTQIPQIPLYCFVGGKSHRCFCGWEISQMALWVWAPGGCTGLALTDLSFGPFGQIRPIGQIGRIGHF